MVVICVTDCPAKIRGDLSKWLFEISTGVYVGNLSARVRDELWKRICQNVKHGRAVMVFSAESEQGFLFRTHHTKWQPKDFDGITLMQRPSPNVNLTNGKSELEKGFSKAARYQQIRKNNVRKKKAASNENFVVLDLETTGLDFEKNQILEIGAIVVKEGQPIQFFEKLINQDNAIPCEIQDLTGITNEMIRKKGVPISDALEALMEITDHHIVYGYNVAFDCSFLLEACQKENIHYRIKKVKDVQKIARKITKKGSKCKLSEIAEELGITARQKHRALADCRLTLQVLNKLNEMKNNLYY